MRAGKIGHIDDFVHVAQKAKTINPSSIIFLPVTVVYKEGTETEVLEPNGTKPYFVSFLDNLGRQYVRKVTKFEFDAFDVDQEYILPIISSDILKTKIVFSKK